MKTAHLPSAVLALAASAAFSLHAAPVMIDDFVNDQAPSTSGFFLPGDMLGGELDVHINLLDEATVEISGGILTLSDVVPKNTGTNNAQLVYDGVDGHSAYAYGLPDVDLTGGGSNDRFAIALTSVTGSIDVMVRVHTDSVNFMSSRIDDVTGGGILEFPFADFEQTGAGADFAAAKQVVIYVYFEDEGDGFSMDSIMARGPLLPDTVRPALQLQNAKALRTPRQRHTVRGRARDNVAVAKVEVKSRLQKGWRKVQLKPSGSFRFKTKRLKSGKNLHRFRAIDTSGNRSKVLKARPTGS